jgi:hypothetical protein
MIRWAVPCMLAASVAAAAPAVTARATRILSPSEFPGWQAHNVAFPSVLFEPGTRRYRMFYAGSPASRVNASTWDRWVTLTATSRDGLAWTFPDDYQPVLHAHAFREGEVADPAALVARFDSVSAFGGSALREPGGYRLWYTGWSGGSVPLAPGIVREAGFAIGLATSPDGTAWTKQAGAAGAGAVLAPGAAGEPDALGAGQPSVLRDGDALRMWYECFDGTRWRVCAAASSDGVAWAKEGVAVDTGPEGAPDALGLRNPVVVRRGAAYELWYQGQAAAPPHYRVLRARSADGRSWQRVDAEVALHPEHRVSGDERIHVDSVIVLPDGTARVFFAKEVTTPVKTAYGPVPSRGYHIYTESVRH